MPPLSDCVWLPLSVSQTQDIIFYIDGCRHEVPPFTFMSACRHLHTLISGVDAVVGCQRCATVQKFPQVTQVILRKGWRCLDCTVCEGCGGPSDESRLLLCDDCDISYHTYCLRPPLSTVPKGTWKCKW